VVKQITQAVDMEHDLATLDAIVMIELEQREALFFNIAQIKSGQLKEALSRNSVIPSLLALVLDPTILTSHKAICSDALKVVADSAGSEMKKRLFWSRCGINEKAEGQERQLNLRPIGRWLKEVMEAQFLKLDRVTLDINLDKSTTR